MYYHKNHFLYHHGQLVVKLCVECFSSYCWIKGLKLKIDVGKCKIM